MDEAADETGPAIARVLVARRGQIRVRIGLCVIIAGLFQVLTGIVPAVAWATIYIALQVFEYRTFRHVTENDALPVRARIAFLLNMVASNLVFAFFGIMESSVSGTWGLVCAGLLWSGAILNGAIVSGESRIALTCAILPPLLHFFSVPYFVIENGGTFGAGIAIVAGGLLNGVGAIVIWSTGRRLAESVARASETGRLALLDPETGLPNRYALQRILAERPKADGNNITVVAVIGLDRFTHLRGAIGHAAMIDLIRELAARFTHAYPGATVARLSNANSGLVFTVADMTEAYRVAADLRAALTTPVLLREHRIDVTVTVGLSEAGDAVQSAADVSIIDRAMIAMEQTRAARKTIGRFDAALYGNPGCNLSLMSEMLRAFDNGQMSVSYQPKCEVQSSRIVGVEALIRWTHPERGPIRPDLFVGMAEETGHIAVLTDWVLRRALEDQCALYDAGHDFCMSINWSGRLIDDEAFTDQALALAASACGKLCLEVTETAIIGNPQLARQTLERFRAAGVTISIDDYGSGLSSLAYLKNIPADELKIDKAFVMNMAADPVDALLARSAVSLAHSLGLKVVAEGVEDQASFELLRAMGCDLAQGYFIARPMALAELLTFLRQDERVAV